jgi:hypothetical protein
MVDDQAMITPSTRIEPNEKSVNRTMTLPTWPSIVWPRQLSVQIGSAPVLEVGARTAAVAGAGTCGIGR